MRKKLLNIGTTLFSIALTIMFMYYISNYFFIYASKWVFEIFEKFFAFQITPIDHFLVHFFPLIFIPFLLRRKLNFSKQMLLMTIIGIFSIFMLFLVGMAIGIYTWGSDPTEPLLPEYILIQPFEYYWTVFISIGISIPILILRNKTKKVDATLIDQ